MQQWYEEHDKDSHTAQGKAECYMAYRDCDTSTTIARTACTFHAVGNLSYVDRSYVSAVTLAKLLC